MQNSAPFMLTSSDPEQATIIVNHVGFATEDTKQAVFPVRGTGTFQIQDMGQNDAETLGAFESWKPVFTGTLQAAPSPWGQAWIGDFSALRKPGIYRVVLPDDRGRSHLFAITDGTLANIPRMLLDYIHHSRCGDFSNELRGPCHLDDGVLSDSGRQIDASGGWHDAGDTRKWMVHCILPAQAMALYRHRHSSKHWNHWQETPWNDDLLAETAWGIRFILKMQDPETGMIYEDVGGGSSTGRSFPGMSWWYENHAGCCADNSENRFTDNLPGSGDERPVRTRYNPIVQYTNIAILLDAVPQLAQGDPELARKSRETAQACWNFMQNRTSDDFHSWTSVRAWRLLAALAMGEGEQCAVDGALEQLLDTRDAATGFWFMDSARTDYYRGILHSAQPLIALTTLIDLIPDHPQRDRIETVLRETFEHYVEPMRATNPFGIIPFGLFSNPVTPGDTYRKLPSGHAYRFFMPANSPQRVNHGLGGHWMSWAHALAYMASVLDTPACRNAALDQIRWMVGNNPGMASFINGVGYNHPMPHSRFFGQIPGGIMIGPRGDAEDNCYVDDAARADWSTCEYWMTCAANLLMALSHLLPEETAHEGLLGRA